MKTQSTSKTEVALARIDERITQLEKEIHELKSFLKTEYLRHVNDRVTRIEAHNAAQDKKLEANTKALWKAQAAYVTVLVVLNVAFMMWRAFSG